MSHLNCDRQIVESAAGVGVPRDITRVFLPATNRHVAVPGLQFDQPCLPARLLARADRCPGSSKRVEDGVARLAAVAERALDQFHRLHRRVLLAAGGPLDEPDVALVPCAAPEVLGSLAPAVENRFVLALIVRPDRNST